MDRDLLKLVVESIEKSQQRARRAFFLSLLVSCLAIVFAFNFSIAQGNVRPEKGDVDEYKIRLQNYLNRYTYAIPVLGISISADDFSIFGTTAVFVFSFYFVSCLRNTVVQMLNLQNRTDTTDADFEMIAFAVTSEVVLNTARPPLHLANVWQRIVSLGALQHLNIYRFLILVPFTACLAVIGSELRATYFVSSLEAERSSCEVKVPTKPATIQQSYETRPDKDGMTEIIPHYEITAVPCPTETFFQSLHTRFQKIRVIIFECLSGTATAIVCALCLAGIYYTRITESLEKQFRSMSLSPAPPTQPVAPPPTAKGASQST